MKSHSQFWVRISPTVERDWENIKVDEDQNIIHVRSCEDLRRKEDAKKIYWQFKVHGVLENQSQEYIYESLFTEQLKKKIIDGFDLTLLAFGNSGTGKTYSLSGLETKFENRGIIPRFLEFLFNKKNMDLYYDINISLTYVEIIGKEIHNLLQKGKPKIVKPATSVEVKSLCEALNIIFQGHCQRKVENLETHCGTSILTVFLTKRPVSCNDTTIKKSKVHIVDTAGTEFGNNPSKSLKCHNDANLIKCQLNTIYSWAEWDFSERTPNWRTSKLASYLGKSLSKGYVRCLGHISVTTCDIPSTISTLLFGTRLMKLPSPKLVQGKTRDLNIYIRNLEDEILEMKGSRAIDKQVYGIYQPNMISQSQMKHVLQLMKSFLNSEISEISFKDIAHPQILIQAFKDIYDTQAQEMQTLKDEIENLKAEHGAMLKKIPETDLKVRSSRKRTSSSSIRSKRDRKKKSFYKGDNVSITETIPSRDDNPDEIFKGYDLTKIHLETEEAGERNFAKTFTELLSTNIQRKMRIDMHKQDVEDSLRTKIDMAKEMTDIRYKLNELRIALEDKRWESESKHIGTDCGESNTQLQKTSIEITIEYEIEDLQKKFIEARNKAMHAHRYFIAASKALNNELSEAEILHNDYSKNLYSSTLILPPMDAFKGILSDTDAIEEIDEAKKCYEALPRRP